MKKLRMILAVTVLATALSGQCALAMDYSFAGDPGYDFYNATNYEDVYGSAYLYGGTNVSEYQGQPLGGVGNAWAPERPEPSASGTESAGSAFPIWEWPVTEYTPTLFTDAGEVERSDGSIGTLNIPSLDISYKAYDGATASNMNRGVAHFSETSAWDGNVALCGHNRGSSHNIGSIKNLEIGDTIKYTTTLGTRVYSVTYVGRISNDDWSYMDPTTDNRITLVTCLADHPEVRICVQAVER